MKYCISIDWFQVFCRSTAKIDLHPDTYIQGLENCPAGYKPMYHIMPGREHHSIFRNSFSIDLHGFCLMHVHYTPKMRSLDPLSVAIKVSNRALYSGTWDWYLKDIMRLLDLTFVSISRMDICCDFQHFAEDLDPRLFIQRYLAEGPLNDGVQYIRKGSNKYFVIGRKRRKYVDNSGLVDNDRTQNQPENLRFGSHQSGVSAYLYNKSLELFEKHHKPYIRRLWEENGIIEDESKPVWRLEFSVKSKSMTVENKSSSQICKTLGLRDLRALNISDFATPGSVENIFWAYCNKFWVFRQLTEAKYIKDMPIVHLFDVDIEPTIIPRDMSLALDSGRSEMLAGRTLQKIADECTSLDTDQKHILYRASLILVQIGVMKKSIFDNDVPPELNYYSPYEDVWQQLLRNYRIRPSQLNRLRYRCEGLLAKRMSELMEDPLWLLLCDKSQYVPF